MKAKRGADLEEELLLRGDADQPEDQLGEGDGRRLQGLHPALHTGEQDKRNTSGVRCDGDHAEESWSECFDLLLSGQPVWKNVLLMVPTCY